MLLSDLELSQDDHYIKKQVFSSEIDILIHNWNLEQKYVPLNILNMCIFYFGLTGKDCI